MLPYPGLFVAELFRKKDGLTVLCKTCVCRGIMNRPSFIGSLRR
jgi:hypothetical protein